MLRVVQGSRLLMVEGLSRVWDCGLPRVQAGVWFELVKGPGLFREGLGFRIV